jgi:hypothetical protein
MFVTSNLQPHSHLQCKSCHSVKNWTPVIRRQPFFFNVLDFSRQGEKNAP